MENKSIKCPRKNLVSTFNKVIIAVLTISVLFLGHNLITLYQGYQSTGHHFNTGIELLAYHLDSYTKKYANGVNDSNDYYTIELYTDLTVGRLDNFLNSMLGQRISKSPLGLSKDATQYLYNFFSSFRAYLYNTRSPNAQGQEWVNNLSGVGELIQQIVVEKNYNYEVLLTMGNQDLLDYGITFTIAKESPFAE